MIVDLPNGTTTTFNFRETAPANASKNMYTADPLLAQLGGLASGVPGEIRGLATAHQQYGRLPWHALFEPSVKLGRYGFRVTRELRRRLEIYRKFIESSPNFAAIYAPNGTIADVGDTIYRSAYANTLETIGKHGPDAFYTGDIAQSIVTALSASGGQ